MFLLLNFGFFLLLEIKSLVLEKVWSEPLGFESFGTFSVLNEILIDGRVGRLKHIDVMVFLIKWPDHLILL